MLEPRITDQWFMRTDGLAAAAGAAVRSGETRFVPGNWANVFHRWMDNIEPWCISRQLWYGHQIPAWYGEDGEIFVAETAEEAAGLARAHYGRDVALTRDPDILDTWFSSALWPFATLGWPDETPELARYYPQDLLVTGFDIIFFWVARMMMQSIHFEGRRPSATSTCTASCATRRGRRCRRPRATSSTRWTSSRSTGPTRPA